MGGNCLGTIQIQKIALRPLRSCGAGTSSCCSGSMKPKSTVQTRPGVWCLMDSKSSLARCCARRSTHGWMLHLHLHTSGCNPSNKGYTHTMSQVSSHKSHKFSELYEVVSYVNVNNCL